jgi:hypothetical protein
MLSFLQGLGLLLALSPLASTADLSPLYNVTITVTIAVGRGCPDGTASATLSEDGTIATLGFDAHEMYFGPSYPPSRKVEDCIVNLQFDFPLGFRYIFVDSTYHGSARLGASMEAVLETKFYSATAADEPIFDLVSTRVNLAGPMDGEYTKTGVISKTEDWEYSACGRTTAWSYVTNRVLVGSAAASSDSVLQDTAASLEKQQPRLSWFPCT